MLKHFDGVQIGLTATPCVANLDEVAPDEEDKLFVRDTLRFFEVDKPTFILQAQGRHPRRLLVPYQIYKAKTVKTAAEGGFEVKRDELDWSAMDARDTSAEFEQLFEDSATIMVDPSALERRFTIPERNRAIVREFRQVMENGYHGRKGVLSASRSSARPSSSPSPSATPKPWPNCSMPSLPTRSPHPKSAMPTTWYPAWGRTTPWTA